MLLDLGVDTGSEHSLGFELQKASSPSSLHPGKLDGEPLLSPYLLVGRSFFSISALGDLLIPETINLFPGQLDSLMW